MKKAARSTAHSLQSRAAALTPEQRRELRRRLRVTEISLLRQVESGPSESVQANHAFDIKLGTLFMDLIRAGMLPPAPPGAAEFDPKLPWHANDVPLIHLMDHVARSCADMFIEPGDPSQKTERWYAFAIGSEVPSHPCDMARWLAEICDRLNNALAEPADPVADPGTAERPEWLDEVLNKLNDVLVKLTAAVTEAVTTDRRQSLDEVRSKLGEVLLKANEFACETIKIDRQQALHEVSNKLNDALTKSTELFSESVRSDRNQVLAAFSNKLDEVLAKWPEPAVEPAGLAKAADQHQIDIASAGDMVKVSTAARHFGVSEGHVSRLASGEKVTTNGKTGRERRVGLDSVKRYFEAHPPSESQIRDRKAKVQQESLRKSGVAKESVRLGERKGNRFSEGIVVREDDP